MKERGKQNRTTWRNVGYGAFGVLLSLGPVVIGRLVGGCAGTCAGCLRCLALVPLGVTSLVVLRKGKARQRRSTGRKESICSADYRRGNLPVVSGKHKNPGASRSHRSVSLILPE